MAYEGINGDLKFNDQIFAKAQTVPQTDSADGNGGSFQMSDCQNAFNVKVVANTNIVVIATESFTVELHDSADDVTFAKLNTLYTVTAGVGNTTITAGTEMAEIPLPANAKRYVKAVITSEGLNTGKIDIFPVYVAR
jgi:hypothetical protein